MAVQLQSAPAVAVIDDSNNLTLSWQPFPGPDGLFDQYAGWDITTQAGLSSPITVTKAATLNAGETNTSRTYTQTLILSDYTLTMKADAAVNPPGALDSNVWQTNGVNTTRAFPGILQAATVHFDNSSVLRGQTLNVTLDPSYTNADQWQVIWPDGSNTGWLPLTANVVARQFQTPGAGNIVTQTRRLYTGSQFNPPSTLIRQVTKQIFVIDQQAANTTAASSNLTTTLGLGGTEGFEIIDTSSSVVAPSPWEVIARALVRDTITSELKLLVATSRFSNASSLLGTMAIDVFPIAGRPHAKELIVPPFELITGSNTSAVPVKIQTAALPNIIVGKSINDALGGTLQMSVKTNTGINPFIWNATGLPSGVFLSANGVISGTPLVMGTFQVTFSVQDSGTPFSIDEVTLSLLVQTDLKVLPSNTVLPVATVGTPYSQQMTVGNIVATATTPGGLPPYKWSTPAGALPIGLSIDPNTGLISGVPATYNSTTDFSKTYSVVVQVTDAIGAKATNTYTITLQPAPLSFGPVDQPLIFASQQFKMAVPVYGGRSPYTLTSFLDDGAGITSHALVDGQVEVDALVPTTGQGQHQFSITIKDSTPPTQLTATAQFTYNVDTQVSDLRFVDAFVSHVWAGISDAASANPIVAAGSATGFTISNQTLTATNGLIATLTGSTQTLVVSGPATSFRNSEVRVPMVLNNAGNPVATISREYTLLSHNDASNPGVDIGLITTFAHPYIVGDFVGLNPRKPRFNSPDIAAFNSLWTARVQAGSALPPGLSFDANTGLIYGTVSGLYTNTSVIEYVDSLGVIHGTITINWTITKSDFQVTSTFSDGQLGNTYTLASPMATIPAPPGLTLTGASIYSGTLPAGLAIGLDGTGANAVLTGTPTEAGYFDVWFQLAATGNRNSFLYRRVVVDYIKPLTILTPSLPSISTQAYSVTLQGFGGVPPYISPNGWTSPQFPSGVGTGNFAGLTLNQNTGVLSGTLTTPPGTSPTDLGNITIQLTDTRGASSAVKAVFDLTFDNRLRIVTPTTGIATIPSNGTPYTFAMQAAGGVPPYTWQLTTPGSPTANLPSGITFDATNSFGATGTFSGNTTATAYNSTFTITVKDSAATQANGSFVVKTGTSALTIDSTGVGVIPRGEAYLGTLKVVGPFATPVTWQVTPTTSLPNSILSGLALQPNADGGATASITGTYSGVPHILGVYNITQVQRTGTLVTITAVNSLQVGDTVLVAATNTTAVNGTFRVTSASGTTFQYNTVASGTIAPTADTGTATAQGYQILVTAVDNTGQTAFGIVSLVTGTNLKITTTTLPNAIVGGSYNLQMQAVNGVPPYVWTWNQTHPFHGLDISSGGLISGTANALFTQAILFTVTDSLGTPNVATATLTLVSQASGLAITTSSITPATSGRPYTFTLQASGSANLPYTWSISPASANQLPTGLALTAATGVISGQTTLTGFNQSVTFRVTDSIGANVDRTLTVSVVAGLSLQSGPDFVDGTSINYLGYVANGAVASVNPRPNRSFYVVASGVVSQSPANILVTTGNPNITATVDTLDTVNARAFIKLDGAFASGAPGVNQITVSVTDSGVNVTGTFNWNVFSDGVLRLVGANNFPQQLV